MSPSTSLALDPSAQSELVRRFSAVRRATETLADPLSAEDCALQAAPFCSPVKWHLAHTAWFFETFVLAEFVAGWRPLDPAYRTLFNSYYESIGAQHPRAERGLLSRPSLEDVAAYRRHVDRGIATLLASAAGRDPHVVARVELGLQHEQQHQELLLTDVKHLFWRNPLRPTYRPAPRDATFASHGKVEAPPSWRPFAGGEHEVGAADSRSSRAFAYDNEGPRHRVRLEPFELRTRLVTSREFTAFVDDGGYRRPEFWLAEGFDFVRAQQLEAPLYWERADGPWTLFTLAGPREVDPDEPVCHVSFFEADAFARWAGARLPTEFEWEVAAASLPIAGTFLESEALHPRPAGTSSSGDERALRQMFGDVWQWTRSTYAPYPGYVADGGALGEYNGKFMVNQLVLRGGSCVSPRSHLRATYRNFFHAHERWQFTGLRLARDAR